MTREANRLQDLADRHARAAAVLAGRAAFARRCGDLPRAARLEGRLRRLEHREACALARAEACRPPAAALFRLALDLARAPAFGAQP
jgi:hypothetical protein